MAAAAATPAPPALDRDVRAKAEAEQEVAALVPAKPQRPPAKAAPAAKQSAKAKAQAPGANTKGQCKGSAVAKWYTAADGHRKYRCVRPEPVGDTAPVQLY